MNRVRTPSGRPEEHWASCLLKWYCRHRRDLPWRRTTDPYAVWISEIMLQQTRVDTAIPYYERFLQRFPSVQALATAELESVLKTWEGLGYYARARNLHKAARHLVTESQGQIPQTAEQWAELPGIGRYTAAAIASICFHEQVPVVDGNVLRVGARLWQLACKSRARLETELLPRLRAQIPARNPGDFNQAMMELGAMVCLPQNPQCAACPLAAVCLARRAGNAHLYPAPVQTAKIPHYQVGAGLVEQRGRILIARRSTDRMLGGLWELPGGKPGPGESLEQATARRVRAETGLTVTVGRRLCQVRHTYSHFKITLVVFACRPLAGTRKAGSGVDATQWVRPPDLERYAFSTATRKALQQWMPEKT